MTFEKWLEQEHSGGDPYDHENKAEFESWKRQLKNAFEAGRSSFLPIIDLKALNDFERKYLEDATSFSAVRGKQVNRQRGDFPTLEAALCQGVAWGRDGKTMIYAITDMGRSAHIINV